MEIILLEYDIEHQVPEPNTSPHNAYIKRFNRTLEEKTRALLSESGFPTIYWGLAIAAAEYLYNYRIQFVTPFDRWYGRPPDLRYVVVFGSLAYQLLMLKPQGQKFSEVSKPVFVIGYTDTEHFLYHQDARKAPGGGVGGFNMLFRTSFSNIFCPQTFAGSFLLYFPPHFDLICLDNSPNTLF